MKQRFHPSFPYTTSASETSKSSLNSHLPLLATPITAVQHQPLPTLFPCPTSLRPDTAGGDPYFLPCPYLSVGLQRSLPIGPTGRLHQQAEDSTDASLASLISGCSFYASSCSCSRTGVVCPGEVQISRIVRSSSAMAGYGREAALGFAPQGDCGRRIRSAHGFRSSSECYSVLGSTGVNSTTGYNAQLGHWREGWTSVDPNVLVNGSGISYANGSSELDTRTGRSAKGVSGKDLGSVKSVESCRFFRPDSVTDLTGLIHASTGAIRKTGPTHHTEDSKCSGTALRSNGVAYAR